MRLRLGFASVLTVALTLTSFCSLVAIDSAVAAKRISVPFAVPRVRSSSEQGKTNSETAPAAKTHSNDTGDNSDSKAPAPAAAAGRNSDLFNRHAAEKLEADKAIGLSQVHPLTAQLPNHFVTVCVAGCVRDKEHIAGVLPRPSLIEAVNTGPAAAVQSAVGQLNQTAASADPVEPVVAKPVAAEPAVAEPAPKTIACVAGCYGYAAPLPGSVSERAEYRWVTTVTAKSGSDGSERAIALPKAKGKRRSPSGEWFTRINRARGQ
jgi:hypothetical protein